MVIVFIKIDNIVFEYLGIVDYDFYGGYWNWEDFKVKLNIYFEIDYVFFVGRVKVVNWYIVYWVFD